MRRVQTDGKRHLLESFRRVTVDAWENDELAALGNRGPTRVGGGAYADSVWHRENE